MHNRDLIPTKDDGPFTVITNDGYEFQCSTQGDYSKISVPNMILKY